MLEYSCSMGKWMEGKDDYKYQRLPGGRRDTGAQHGALRNCRAVLQLIYRMAGQKQQLPRITVPAQERPIGVGRLFRELPKKLGETPAEQRGRDSAGAAHPAQGQATSLPSQPWEPFVR